MEKKQIYSIVGVIVVAAIVIGAAVAIINQNDGGVKAWEPGDKIIIATSPDFAPYDDIIGDKYVGIDADVCRAVFTEMGLTEGKDYEFQTVNFDSIVLGVTQGKYTMGASGFTQTADRIGKVLFSEEYAKVKQVALVLSTTTDITKADNLKGVKIAVQTGTTGDTLATKNYENSSASNIQRLTTYSDALNAVTSGKAKVLILDSKTAESMVASSDKNLKVLDISLPGSREDYGFIFNNVNTDLCMQVTNTLRDLKEAEDSIIDDIIEWYASNDNKSGTPSYFDRPSTGA